MYQVYKDILSKDGNVSFWKLYYSKTPNTHTQLALIYQR
jgi:hypothetical protein